MLKADKRRQPCRMAQQMLPVSDAQEVTYVKQRT